MIEQDFSADQGSDLEIYITVYNDEGNIYDMTNITSISCFLKRHYDARTHYQISGMVYGDPSMGKILLYATAIEMSNIPYGNYVYDVEVLTNSSKRFKVLKGVVTINPEVTR